MCTTDILSRFFMQAVEKKFPGDRERLARMSLIEEGYPKQVRMAYLAIIGAVFLFLHNRSLNLLTWMLQVLARSTVSPNFTLNS